MKVSVRAQNLLEWLALKTGLVPTPLAYGHFGFLMSHFLLEAVDKGIFEAIGQKKISIQEIAGICEVNQLALEELVNVLASMKLVKIGGTTISLSSSAKKWLLKESPQSMYCLLMFDKHVCMKWMDGFGKFLETGRGLQYHDKLSESDWCYYQQAMRATAKLTISEAVKKIPLPLQAAKMLDIGGAHGLFSMAFCNKYPSLSATIIDLPEATDQAKKLFPFSNKKITSLAGNILNMDFEDIDFDFVLMASLAHHFTAEENQRVVNKVFKLLKPGGYFAIIDLIQNESEAASGNMLSAIGSLFFSFTSTSGALPESKINKWFFNAGFIPVKKSSFFSLPGYKSIICAKPK